MQSKEELQAKLDAACRRLDELTEEVARNDDKMRRTQQRELKLLQAEDFDALLTVLVDGLRASYGLEYVSGNLFGTTRSSMRSRKNPPADPSEPVQTLR